MGDDRKQFRLQILGADEDIPRFIRAYGRACGGEFAYLCEPGQFAYLVFMKGGTAYAWTGNNTYDAPGAPTIAVLPADAVAKVRELGAAGKKAPMGPVTYRGQWKGTLWCNGEGKAPTVVLTRKVAAYASITLQSQDTGDGEMQWQVTLHRDPRWFGKGTLQQDAASPSLMPRGPQARGAFMLAYAQLTGLVGEACSVRDTQRRAAFDPEHAKTHPIKHPKPPKSDPTERIKAPKGAKPPKAAKPAPKAEKPVPPKAAAPAPKAEKPPAGTIVESKLPRRKKPKAEKPAKAEKPSTTAPPASGELSQADKDKAIMDALSAQMDKLLKDAA